MVPEGKMAPERPADANLRLDRKRDDCGTDPKCCTIPESSFQALQHIKNCASCVWGCPHHRYIGRHTAPKGAVLNYEGEARGLRDHSLRERNPGLDYTRVHRDMDTRRLAEGSTVRGSLLCRCVGR